jgi:hypothetical protein
MRLVDPTDRADVDAWVLRLLSEHPKDEVVRRIWTVIESADGGVPGELARALVRLEGPEHLMAEIESGNLVGPVDPHPLAAATLRGEPVTDEQASTLLEQPFAELELAATLWDVTAYLSRDEAMAQGIDLAPLFRSPALKMGPRVRERVDAAYPAREDRIRARWAERLTAYQSSILERGRMLVNDPRTGDRATYLGCLMRGDVFVFRFGRGDSRTADFFLVARGPAGQLRALYLPDRDAMVALDDTEEFPIRPLWPAVKMQLVRALVKNDRPQEGVPRAGKRARPEITVNVGGAQNFAHVLWNYFGGLAREELLDNLPQAQRVVHIGSEFFGPLTDFYPEIGTESFSQRPRAGRRGHRIASHRHLEIPLGSTLLWPEALDRVTARAHSLRDDPVVAPILQRMSRYSVRLYVALRVRDKSWADADQQLPRLIDELVSRHPDACVLLDGFSVPSGVDHVSGRWEGQQRELGELIGTIQQRVREPERLVDLMGLDLLRSIAVLSGATCYLCPAGTAHHKIDWFYDLPGVLYISEELRDHPEPVIGHRQRSGSHQPRVVVGSDLGPEHVRIQRIGDLRPGLANFTLPWDRVWAELGPLLEEPSALGMAARSARRVVRRIVGPTSSG